jgi:hypothetical protein
LSARTSRQMKLASVCTARKRGSRGENGWKAATTSWSCAVMFFYTRKMHFPSKRVSPLAVFPVCAPGVRFALVSRPLFRNKYLYVFVDVDDDIDGDGHLLRDFKQLHLIIFQIGRRRSRTAHPKKAAGWLITFFRFLNAFVWRERPR